jgi:hypothetical protein
MSFRLHRLLLRVLFIVMLLLTVVTATVAAPSSPITLIAAFTSGGQVRQVGAFQVTTLIGQPLSSDQTYNNFTLRSGIGSSLVMTQTTTPDPSNQMFLPAVFQ